MVRGFFWAEGGSKDPKGKVAHWSARIKTTKEESEEMKGAENEKQGSKMEVDEATPGMQPSRNETEGGFTMCEVEERQEARAKAQRPTRRVIRVESEEEMQDYVCETLAISQEEADEIGFVPVNFEEPIIGF